MAPWPDERRDAPRLRLPHQSHSPPSSAVCPAEPASPAAQRVALATAATPSAAVTLAAAATSEVLVLPFTS